MSRTISQHGPCDSKRVVLYALQALPKDEVPEVEAHLAACVCCRRKLSTLSPVVESLVTWPTELLRPSASLLGRLLERVAGEARAALPLPPGRWAEPEWAEVAPGISCKLLATDTERNRVSMLVRLAPGTDYPPHRHAGVEELHLLDGELMIDERKVYPGDYNRAECGSVDSRVWSETGCTCLLIASTRDEIR